jgi:uncharacterized protein YuzE
MQKPVTLTVHAHNRLQDRHIDLTWVEGTVRKPDWIEPDPLDRLIERRFRAIPEFGGRVLRVACVETKFGYSGYKRNVRQEREAKAMTDITYDAEADAVYIAVGRGKVDRTEETGPFIYDVDAEGHIVGIEILSASKVLAPGDWKKAEPPVAARVSAAE